MESLGSNLIFNWDNMNRLLEGLLVTLNVAFVSVILSTILGIIFGIVMISKRKVVKIISTIYLESIRIIPLMVWLFIFYFGVPTLLDIHLDSIYVG
ncbi:ABC transporter permease subunit, partial [Clostridium perfringens]|nr:ABC transporter permease subunit [Clostridium perfringens]